MTTKTKSGKTSSTNMAETSMNYEACYEMYLKNVREKLERNGWGVPYVESGLARQMYLDKVREIVGRYIDENDVKIASDKSLYHPAWCGPYWEPDRNSPEEAAILEALNNPDEQGKAQAVLKSVMKMTMFRYSLKTIMRDRLWFPYKIHVLKEAKEFMARDDFSSLMSYCFFKSLGYSERLYAKAEEGVTKEDILELLDACNPEELFLKDIKSCFYVDCDNEITVYLDDVEAEELNASSVFFWVSSPVRVLDDYLDIIGGYAGQGAYTAKINVADILGFFRRDLSSFNQPAYVVILNPDKLHDIEYVDEASDLCDEEELEEIDEAYRKAYDEDDDEESLE